MLSISPEQDWVVVTASGTLDRADYERFVPEFERIAAARGRVAMLIDASGFEGWDPSAAWEDLKFDATHEDRFGPMAIVAEDRWKEWGTTLARPFLRAEMRLFQPSEIKAARDWLARTNQHQPSE